MKENYVMSNLYNAKNERVKYDYAIYLSNAKQRDRKTVLSVMEHLHKYEDFRNFADFSIINEKIIHNYVEKLSRENKSLSYMDHNLRTIREFYFWQRGLYFLLCFCIKKKISILFVMLLVWRWCNVSY